MHLDGTECTFHEICCGALTLIHFLLYSYDEHVIMAGYPFLDIKTRMGGHNHVLAEIMQVCLGIIIPTFSFTNPRNYEG